MQEYDAKADIWSVGCVFAELIGRAPLFPGEDYVTPEFAIIVPTITPPPA